VPRALPRAARGRRDVNAAADQSCLQALLEGCEPRQGGLAWLNELRAHALERANSLALPTTRDEEWRFTDISPIKAATFRPASPGVGAAVSDVAPYFADAAHVRLVFVDGTYAPALSRTGGLPPGMTVAPLADALTARDAALEPHLARHAAFEDDVFAAVNLSRLRDGAFIGVEQGRRIALPVEVLYFATQADRASYPRTLLVAGAGSECTLIETYAGFAGRTYFTNAVTEIVVGAGATVRHVRLQQESREAFHIGATAARIERDAAYASHAVAIGARISRHNHAVRQAGEGAEARLDGLALADERQLVDTHSLMDHALPHGRCRQVMKCIVGGAAHAVFNGKVLVRPGAQRTDAAQESRNLLLSERARVDAKPQLEIFADDVKCAHGATVGQLDAEQVFYLRSRGLSEGRARSLLVHAFGAELIARIPVPALAARLAQAVLERTAGTGAS